MKKIVLLFILMIVFVTGCSFSSENEVIEEKKTPAIEEVSIDEVKEIVDNYDEYPDVDIIDVRSEEEFEEGHIEGAINIPLTYIEEINIDPERKIILYCQSGRRSNDAAIILKELGYDNVLNMGSIENWPYDLVEE